MSVSQINEFRRRVTFGDGYSFEPTLHGPNNEHRCVDCGGVCYAVPECVNARCEKCSQARAGVGDRLRFVAPLGEKTLDRGTGIVVSPEARRVEEARRAGAERKPAPGGPRWPDPVVPLRDAVSAEIPSSPRNVDQLARRQGWRTRVTYAAGTSTTRYGDPGKLVESIAVRCAKRISDEQGDDLIRVVMVWHRSWEEGAAYRFTNALVWGTRMYLRRVGLHVARDVLESIHQIDEDTREEQ
jgi:hypothetical protein